MREGGREEREEEENINYKIIIYLAILLTVNLNTSV